MSVNYCVRSLAGPFSRAFVRGACVRARVPTLCFMHLRFRLHLLICFCFFLSLPLPLSLPLLTSPFFSLFRFFLQQHLPFRDPFLPVPE